MKVTVGAGIIACAISDAEDRLVFADEPLAGIQLGCGGELPGVIAIPELLEVVRKVRRYQLRLARRILAQGVGELLSGWVEVEPRDDGEAGCSIVLRSLEMSQLADEAAGEADARRLAVERHLAELTAQLDARQCLQAVEANAQDLQELCGAMSAGIGRPWTDFVRTEADSHHQPLHWRLLDGVGLVIPGSTRGWRARLVPQLAPGMVEPAGFELLLVCDEPMQSSVATPEVSEPVSQGLIGNDVAPVLRQPIERIRANAETIRARLAGPLSENYRGYASEIVAAAEHLLGLLDDLADLEVVESESFTTQPDAIDLAEVARQAAGILAVRAQARNIRIDAPQRGVELPATAEFRRVLQVLLNLLGNAIVYSPPDSAVWIRVEDTGDWARVTVADQGPGLSATDIKVIFDKFQRLGRSGDGGSGLGLYISRRLARAMGGELSVESAPGQGARFVLELPGPVRN